MAETESADGGGEEQEVNNPGGCSSCDTPEDELMVVYDRNLDFPWKSGNPYSRMCPNCGARTFTAKAYWQSQEVPYAIPKGEDDPKPLYDCPYDDCDGELVGMVDSCPTCERDIEWEGADDSDDASTE